jgi:hypothetical protein
MDQVRATEQAERPLEAWNTQDVDRVLSCYTDDVRYRDPNTRGDVEGSDAMGRYLTGHRRGRPAVPSDVYFDRAPLTAPLAAGPDAAEAVA